MNKEIKIIPPEGYEIDKENSTFECVKFKPIVKKWKGDKTQTVEGWFISLSSGIVAFTGPNISENYNLFATEKQAKSALAMARISQIMANDKRFGGPITDEEWKNSAINKYVIGRSNSCMDYISKSTICTLYHFIAFHTAEQRNLFLEENLDLVKEYLMIDD